MNSDQSPHGTKIGSETELPDLSVSENHLYDVAQCESFPPVTADLISPAIVKPEKVSLRHKRNEHSDLLVFKIVFLACATAPPMLCDIGFDKEHCLLVAMLASLVVPAFVSRVICKSSIWQTFQVWFFATIFGSISCALILTVLAADPLKSVILTSHLPVTGLILAVIWMPAFLLEWLIDSLWSANVLGLVRDESSIHE